MNKLGSEKTPFFFIISFDKKNYFIQKLNEINDDTLVFEFPELCFSPNTQYKKNTKISNISYVPKDEYKKGFEIVVNNLKLGNSFLTNYTKPSKIKIDGTLNDIFYSSKARYKLRYKDEFVCFSPETFIQITDNEISSYPMKGTADLSLPNAEKEILENKKEAAEHATIVDLIRNDLSIVAKNVRVSKYRFSSLIETTEKKLLQISSEIKGSIDYNWHKKIGDIFNSLLPAGSISGAPKKKTVSIIEESEKYKRNFYTGVAGIYDGNKLDSCVLIRFIEKIGEDFFYKAGGGVTYMSNLEDEYNELKNKIYVPIK